MALRDAYLLPHTLLLPMRFARDAAQKGRFPCGMFLAKNAGMLPCAYEMRTKCARNAHDGEALIIAPLRKGGSALPCQTVPDCHAR